VEVLDILVNLNGLEGLVELLDVGNKLISGLVLSSRVKILSLVVEEEGLWGLEVFVFLEVILKFEFKIVIRFGVGWSSDRSGFDVLEFQIQLGERELGVAINSEDVVDDGGSDLDVFGHQVSILDFQLVDSESSGVENIPGVIIWAILKRDSWFAESSWDIIALGVGPEFADLGLVEWGVVVIFSRNDEVVRHTISNNCLLLNFKVVGLGQVNLGEVQLKGGGDTSLDVVGPFVNLAVENDPLGLSVGNFNLEGFGQRLKLVVGLVGKLGHVQEIELAVVSSELNSVQFDIKGTTSGGDMKVTGDVEKGTKCYIILRSGL
jgi:hypothetical protein